MKLPKTFLPGKELDEKIEELSNSEPYLPTCLAIALCYVEHGGWISDIMVWMPDMDKPVTVARRANYINAFCLYDNLLFDTGDYNQVIDTLNNKQIAKRGHMVSSLCVHDGVMYDGGLKKIYRTDNGKVIAERDGWVKALCSHNGEIYDAGSYKQVMKTLEDKPVAERKEWVYSLCSHDSNLYDGATDNKIRDTLTNKVVAKRDGIPFTMFSFNNKLYDAGQYYPVYETKRRWFKKKLLSIEWKERYSFDSYRGITAIQPIPAWLANQLMLKSR
ncbi:hypothetical protein FJZ53_00915 [Candidatus Woesearchaeota archaeon]|nr:hypothetical protein [Candidatus Woesearchaeota archaeon]